MASLMSTPPRNPKDLLLELEQKRSTFMDFVMQRTRDEYAAANAEFDAALETAGVTIKDIPPAKKAPVHDTFEVVGPRGLYAVANKTLEKRTAEIDNSWVLLASNARDILTGQIARVALESLDHDYEIFKFHSQGGKEPERNGPIQTYLSARREGNSAKFSLILPVKSSAPVKIALTLESALEDRLKNRDLAEIGKRWVADKFRWAKDSTQGFRRYDVSLQFLRDPENFYPELEREVIKWFIAYSSAKDLGLSEIKARGLSHEVTLVPSEAVDFLDSHKKQVVLAKRYVPFSYTGTTLEFHAVPYPKKDAESARNEAFSRLAGLGKQEITTLEFAYVLGEGYQTAKEKAHEMKIPTSRGKETQIPLGNAINFLRNHEYRVGTGEHRGRIGWKPKTQQKLD